MDGSEGMSRQTAVEQSAAQDGREADFAFCCRQKDETADMAIVQPGGVNLRRVITLQQQATRVQMTAVPAVG